MKLRLGDPSTPFLLNSNKPEGWGEASHQRWLRELENAREKLLEGTTVVKTANGGPSASNLHLPSQHSSRVTGAAVAWPGQAITESTSSTQEPVKSFLRTESIGSVSLTSASYYPSGTVGESVIWERITALMGKVSAIRAEKKESTDKTITPKAGSGDAWSAENIHLTADENGVVVWLRDASIDGEAQARIAEKLRRGLAELGIRLSRINVNGHPIVEGLADTNQLK